MVASMRNHSVTLALSAAALVMAGYAAWLAAPIGDLSTWLITAVVAFIGLATLAAVAAGATRVKQGIAATLLSINGVVSMSSFLGISLLAFDPYGDPRYALFLSAIIALAVVGLIRGWFLCRWLALALAAAGILSAGLNLVRWTDFRGAYTWTLAIHISGALLVLATLLGADVRARFEKKAAPVWTSREPLLRALRVTIIAILAAIPMLLVYGWMQPVAPATGTTAIILAAFLSVSVALAARRKVIGALGLVLGGLALLAQTGATVALAYSASSEAGWIALYYVVFWTPAGLAALVCGCFLIRPALRLLRR